MGNLNPVADAQSMTIKTRHAKWPPELSIFLVLVGISLFFEVIGWLVVGQSFLFNAERLEIIVLQMAVIGIIAVGVNLVIITSGIDLSSGSVVAAAAVVSASLAQVSDFPRAVFPHLTDLPIVWPVLAGVCVGLLVGLLNGSLIALTGIPPFIATLGTMVAARGFAKWFTNGMPVSMLTDQFAAIGAGANPVIIFVVVAAIFHVVLRYTRFGKYTYAIGANRHAAVVSGINVTRHLVFVYAIAGAAERHRRHGDGRAGDLRAVGHGRDVRAGRDRGRRDRRHVAVGRPRPRDGHRDRRADPRRDDVGLHVHPHRRVLPGDGEGGDHRRGRDR